MPTLSKVDLCRTAEAFDRPELDVLRLFAYLLVSEMRDARRATGWTNYSLFLAPASLRINYGEVEDFPASREGVKAFPLNARWQVKRPWPPGRLTVSEDEP